MRLLLDTHIFLWYITGDRRVAPSVRTTIENAESVYVSVATLWEATTKYRLGKLDLPESPHPWLANQREEHGFEALVIDEATVAHLSTLEAHHRDPFDRMLICQALEHDLQLVTVDPLIEKYPVKLCRPPNYCQKLTRPGFGPAAEPPTSSPAGRRHGGCRSAGVAYNFSPATAVPLGLRHVGPGRAA